MPVIFPPVDSATEEGLVAVGGNLNYEVLEAAYHQGIFPWPISESTPLTWFSPDPRGILFVDRAHISKSFKRFLKKTNFEVKYNQNFLEVITNCAFAKRKEDEGTWISEDIINAYYNLFLKQKAYSIEIYENNILVGGLYGVCFGGIISGESMFYKKSNASKLALYSLIQNVKNAGIPFVDTQMVTEVTDSFGAIEVDREFYLKKLEQVKRISITREQLFVTAPFKWT